MGSLGEIMQLCRLCLVKDKVNIPIFEGAGDIRKISHKISACLPVKVAKDDKLPKKICDGCSLKLDVIYQFWNTSTASEKQLLEWVNNPSSLKGESQDSRANVAEHIVLKQEIDNGDSEALDAGEFIDVNDSFENIGYTHDDDDDMSNENIAIKTENDSQSYIEPPRKKQKVVSLSSAESEEDADDPSDAYNRDDSDEEDNDISDAQPTFVNVSDADQQPGPSGVGKSSGDAPKRKRRKEKVRDNTQEERLLYRLLRKKNNLICYVCKDDKTMSEEDLKNHFSLKHPDTPIKIIVICPKEYHLCEICNTEFSSVVYLNKHMESHENQYTCKTCNEGFKKVFEIIVHNKLHAVDEYYVCVVCNYRCTRKFAMESHVDKHVFNKSIYKCETCKKRFSVYKYLQEHQAVHTGEKPFVCETCGMTFRLTNNLLQHIRSRHPEVIYKKVPKFECQICNKSYNRKCQLSKHVEYHHAKDTVVMCDLCGKQFKRKHYLNIHKRIHLGIKNYKCSYCVKAFVTSEHLRNHVRIHTGEKPYKCKFCEKAFNQIQSRKVHERIHTNERPYVCKICSNGFISKSALNNHLNRCNGA